MFAHVNVMIMELVVMSMQMDFPRFTSRQDDALISDLISPRDT